MIAASKIELTVGNDRRRDNLPSGMKLFHQGSLRFCIDGREREMSLFLYLYPVRNESFAERQAHGTKQLNLSTDRQNLIVCGAMKNVLGGIDDGRKDSERCAGLDRKSTRLNSSHTVNS